MKRGLLSYKIGLAIVGILMIGVVVAVVRQEGKAKHDVTTDKVANSIANMLNDYVSSKQMVPDSLTYDGGGSLYISPTHKQGRVCQVVAPYFDPVAQTSPASTTAPYTACGVGYSYEWSALQAKSWTSAVNTQNATLTVDSVPVNTFELAPDAKVFDRNCQPLGLNSIQVGTWVDLYFNPYGSPLVMIIVQA